MPIHPDEYDLLIVSDLHVSEGRRANTKRFSRNEDFFFDEQFSRFLAYHLERKERKWRLIINGDFLDFLQVTTIEGANPDLSRDRDHPEYGLGCGEQETVFKLGKIVEGHWQLFEALSEFIAAGHIVSIGKGNHDVEFHYPAVRRALIDHFRRVYANKHPDLVHEADRINDQSVLFLDWFYYEDGLIWVEHGNQYDKLNCFSYWLEPLLPDIKGAKGADPKRGDEIDLPWGSLFVRYLLNRVEQKLPFGDNIKPVTRFLKWLVRNHPVITIRFLFTDGRYMLRKMARGFQPAPPGAYGRRQAAHDARLQQLAAGSGIAEETLRKLDPQQRVHSVLRQPSGSWELVRWVTRHWWFSLGVVAISLFLVAIGAALELLHSLFPLLPEASRWLAGWIYGDQPALMVFRWLLLPIIAAMLALFINWLLAGDKPPGTGDYLFLAAQDIRRRLRVQYVVMGHTHETDLQSLGDGAEYFNTGTWTKVFSEEERLIREESELVFAQALRSGGKLRVRLMKWDDAAEEPRLVKLFDP